MIMYCVYSNKDYKNELLTKDHIIPLSLGWCDEFYVMAEKSFNSKIGTEIESKISNDSIIKIYRERHNAFGHSKKKIHSEFYTKDNTNSKLIFSYSDGNFAMINPLSKKEVDWPGSFPISIKFDLTAHIKFLAKVVLGTGCFLFKNDFLSNECSNELRDILINDITTNKKDCKYVNFFVNFDKVNFAKEYGTFCKLVNNSVVTIVATDCVLIFLIGICGMEIGNCILKYDTSKIDKLFKKPLGVSIICDNKNNELFINDTGEMLRDNLKVIKGD